MDSNITVKFYRKAGQEPIRQATMLVYKLEVRAVYLHVSMANVHGCVHWHTFDWHANVHLQRVH